jgi:hypothetical protein
MSLSFIGEVTHMIQWEDTYPEEEKDIIEEVPML